jgi:hypothetical protein
MKTKSTKIKNLMLACHCRGKAWFNWFEDLPSKGFSRQRRAYSFVGAILAVFGVEEEW